VLLTPKAAVKVGHCVFLKNNFLVNYFLREKILFQKTLTAALAQVC
jgi:hypothetical protein